ncbi:MAG TPA: glycosyltransferase [Limnobacter sp.]|uniref:glycosyltransferase n=1 Tax=Limnobacter sp. TaxID=2003368 RepID=UPI002ED8B9C6
MSLPFFSVVLPTHVDNAYLDMAVRSILDQEYTQYELLLVVNGPQHMTITDALRQRYGQHPQVQVLSTPMCKLPFALNLGIHAARGNYVVRMDGDDIALPQRLSVLAEHLSQHPALDVLGSNYQIIDEHGTFGAVSRQLAGNAALRSRLPFKCELAHPTLCIRRSLLLAVGGYMYGVASEDYDLWLRLLRHQPAVQFDNLPDVLLQYRFHSGQATSKARIGEFVAHDIGLRLREWLLTGKPMFLLGIARSMVQFVVRKLSKR